jgi:hypothetical protein
VLASQPLLVGAHLGDELRPRLVGQQSARDRDRRCTDPHREAAVAVGLGEPAAHALGAMAISTTGQNCRKSLARRICRLSSVKSTPTMAIAMPRTS